MANNYVVMDGILSSLMEEYATFIDGLNGADVDSDDSFSNELAALASAVLVESENGGEELLLSEEDKIEELFAKISESSKFISEKASEEEFEPSFNLLLPISSHFLQSMQEKNMKLIISNIAQSASRVSDTSVLATLLNYFNNIPVEFTSLRRAAFDALLAVIEEKQKYSYVQSFIPSLEKVFSDLRLSQDETLDYYLKIVDLIEKADGKVAYNLLYKIVSTLPYSRIDVTTSLIIKGLNDASIPKLDELYQLEAVQDLAQKEGRLFELLQYFYNGDLSGYQKFASENGEFLSTNKLDVEVLNDKIRMLALTKLVQKVITINSEESESSDRGESAQSTELTSNNRSLPYETIAKALDVSLTDLEFILIDAIRVGLIEGRLSQTEAKFEIHKAQFVGDFSGPSKDKTENWNLLLGKLDAWKGNVAQIRSVLLNAKEASSA